MNALYIFTHWFRIIAYLKLLISALATESCFCKETRILFDSSSEAIPTIFNYDLTESLKKFELPRFL